MNVFSKKIKWGRNQAQDAREHECRSDRFAGCQPDDQDERGNGEAPASNARQTHGDSNQETNKEVHTSARFEKV